MIYQNYPEIASTEKCHLKNQVIDHLDYTGVYAGVYAGVPGGH